MLFDLIACCVKKITNYFYKNGVEYHTFMHWSQGSSALENDGENLTWTVSSYNGSSDSFCCVDNVDLTSYKYVKLVIGDMTIESTHDVIYRSPVLQVVPVGSEYTYGVELKEVKINGGNTTAELDVDSLTGAYSIRIYADVPQTYNSTFGYNTPLYLNIKEFYVI